MKLDLNITKIKETAIRFTLPVCCSFLIYLLTISPPSNFETLIRWFAILLSGGLWFLCLKMFAESKKWSVGKYYRMAIPVFFPLVLNLYTAKSIFYTGGLLTSGLLILLFIAPFIKKDTTGLDIWLFQYKFLTQILFTFLVSTILILIISFTYYSVFILFNIKFLNSFKYASLFIATFFAPFMVMSGIPNYYNHNTLPEENYPKPIYSILNYFVIPFLLIYSMILYSYSLRILITWNLPKGGVVYLVAIFATMGIIAYFVSYPFFKRNKILLFFERNFFNILIPPVLLLAVAIGIRVYEYGITESRYLVLLLLFWFSMNIYFSFFLKIEKLLKYAFMSIASLLFIASLPKIGPIEISEWSQNNRLENALLASGILVHGKINKPSIQPNDKQTATINSIIDYLVETKKIGQLQKWFKNNDNAKINKNPDEITSEEILKDMGIINIRRT